MLTLDVQDVFALRGGGGALFTAFVDTLIRATASRLPIRPVDIHTNMRVNIPDGGVDTQVDVSGNDPEGRLIPATIWQYKATEYRNISDADIRAEIADHEYAQRLVANGYGYRLCICDEIPPETKFERLAALKGALRAINGQAAEPIILTAGDLVAWANQYPAIVAKTKRLATDKFRFFDSWKTSATFVTPTFVPTPRFEPLRRQVDQHLDWS
jgi:hypothetical protein